MTSIVRRLIVAAFASLWAAGVAAPVLAEEVTVAVAANFTEPAKEIAAAFKKATTGHTATLSFGSSGQFYTQIANGRAVRGVPVGRRRPAEEGRAGRAWRVPAPASPTRSAGWCSIRRRPAWSTTRGAVLKGGKFDKLSIADPAAAPYGVAAIQTMKKLGVYDRPEAEDRAGHLDHPGLSVRRRPARPSSASWPCPR